MRVVVQRVLESLGRAPQSRCDRPPRSHTSVTAHLTPTSINPSKRPDPYDNAMAASVVGLCKTVPIREKGPWRDLGRLEYAALEYVDWFSHRRPRPPKPNASPCLPPPSPPGTPPTSVQLSTTVYQHINLHRRHDVTNTTTPPPGQLRPLTAAQTDAFCTDAGSTPLSTTSFALSQNDWHSVSSPLLLPKPGRRCPTRILWSWSEGNTNQSQRLSSLNGIPLFVTRRVRSADQAAHPEVWNIVVSFRHPHERGGKSRVPWFTCWFWGLAAILVGL